MLQEIHWTLNFIEPKQEVENTTIDRSFEKDLEVVRIIHTETKYWISTEAELDYIFRGWNAFYNNPVRYSVYSHIVVKDLYIFLLELEEMQ